MASYRRPSDSGIQYSNDYQPFDPPLDPIEMQNYASGSHSYERRGSYQNTSSSPSSLLSATRTLQGYAPLDAPPPAAGSEFYSRPPARKSVSATSVNSVGTPMSRYRTDPDTERLVERRSQEIAHWKIHWQTPALMVSLFLCGVVGAIGHHAFYKSLDGKPATSQLTMIRYGTALAFWTKATLVGSVILSYRQRIWSTLRKKAMTMSAIDGLFAATDDPSAFLKWEMMRNAKLATLMAAASWLIPIAAVLSPASLTTGITVIQNATTCPTVATLNFSHESTYNFRDEQTYSGGSLLYYNTTDINASAGYFDYYDQPSKNARRLTTTSAFLKKPVSNTDQAVASCDSGWNCTYTISFQGPGYNCQELASGVDNNTQQLGAMGSPINTTILAPSGTLIYISDVDQSDYADPQLPTDEHGEPIQQPPWPPDLGVFLYEPPLWIGYSINTSNPYPEGSELAAKWQNVHVPKVFKCEHWETMYSVNMNFTEGIQQATVTNRTFLRPIVNTTLTPNPNNASDPTIEPESNYVRPNTDVGLYKLMASYHSLGSLLRDFLRGTIDHSASYPLTRSDISETRLIDPVTAYPVQDLMNQTQAFYEDMIITLLSEPHLIVADTASLSCVKSRSVNVYHYHSTGLWVGYAIVVAVAFSFLLVGALSIIKNGVSSDTYFSRIMVTTRNPTLDRLSVGACLGGDPFPVELRKTKLRFGVLHENEGSEGYNRMEGLFGKVEHCAFGTEGETKEIVKYGTYAGLRKWRKDGSGEEKETLLSQDQGTDDSSES